MPSGGLHRYSLALPYAATLAVHREGKEATVFTINDELQRRGWDAELEKAFGAAGWQSWSTLCDNSLAFNPKGAAQSLKSVAEMAAARKATGVGKSLHDGEITVAEAIASLTEIDQKSRSDERSRLTVRTVADLIGMNFDDADNRFGDRMIADGQNCVVVGPGGIGKSRAVLQLAISMITGRDFLDVRTCGKGLRWLIIQTENSNRRLHNDLRGLLTGLRLSPPEVDEVNRCLLIHTVETETDTCLDVENPVDLAQIERLIKETDPHFVVVDPLNTFTALDLNSDRDMRTVTALIASTVKRGGPHRVPIIVHHSLTGKAGAARAIGFDKASYGRNSKVLYNWARSQFNLAPRNPEDHTELFMSCGKSNNGKPLPDMGIVYDEQRGIYCQDPEFDADEFRAAVGGEKQPKALSIKPEDVAGLFQGTISRTALVHQIKTTFSCQDRRAYKAIAEAQDAKAIIKKGKGNYNVEFFKPDGGAK